jgi:hypothetical protein
MANSCIRLAVVLALFACFGCAASVSEAPEWQPIALDAEIAVSEAFLVAERAEIEGAAAELSLATGGSIGFRLGESGAWRIERAEITECGPDLDAARGCARRALRRIDIDPWRIYPVGVEGFDLQHWGDFRGTALHELGHALGLEHGDGIMDPNRGDGSNCIDAASLAELCALRGCAEQRPTCAE